MSIKGNKQIQLNATKAAGTSVPDESELALINNYSLRELKAEEVYVRRMYLAHNAIDRDMDVFSDALLEDFARTLPGKGFFVKHPGGWDGDSGPGEGVFFAAEVLKMSTDEAIALLGPLEFLPGTKEACILRAAYYIPRIDGDLENKRLIEKIDTGVARFVSIGFGAAHRTPFEGQDGKFLASVIHGPGEANEGSIVWLGAQPGARNAKAAGSREESDMDPKEEIKNLKAKVDKLEGDKSAAEQLADENNAKAKSFDGVKAVVGDLADSPEQLKALVDIGNKYRESLIDSVIKSRRLMGMTGDDEGSAAQARKHYESMGIEMLEEEEKALRSKAPADSGIEGGDPNRSNADEPEGEKEAGTSPGRKALAHAA